MSLAWYAARDWILRDDVEGGYVNDPDDPGGETKYGISKRAYPAVDIANLTADEAAAIYRRDYWALCRCDDLPGPLGLAVFDSAVNQGVAAAGRLFQLMLDWLLKRRLSVDGVIGPETIAAAREAWAEHSTLTLHAYLAFRANHYAQIAQDRAASLKYRRGWFLRLFKLGAECLQITGGK